MAEPMVGLSRWAGNGRGTYTESLQEAWNVLRPKFPLEGLAVSGHKHEWSAEYGFGAGKELTDAMWGESLDIELPEQQALDTAVALRACSEEGGHRKEQPGWGRVLFGSRSAQDALSDCSETSHSTL